MNNTLPTPLPRLSRRSKLWLFIPIFAIMLFLGTVGAKIAYDKFTAPSVYKPANQVTFTSPVQKAAQDEAIIIKESGTKALLPGAKWVPQTFNNCAPATVSMILQYFDFDVNQNVTKSHLRTNPDDKNVFTYEIVQYLKSQYGIESKLFYGGDIAILKKLVANGFYVMVEDWLHPNEDIGHVAIIRGFDDEQGVLIADDSYIGVNITYPYEQFEQTQWKAFNREFLPIYRPGSEELLKTIIGDAWDQEVMYQIIVQTAQNEIAQNENDMYAWFNLGTSLYALNNYPEAKTAFEKSRSIGWPRRMLWYQIQPVQTYNALAQYDKALELTRIGLASNDSFAELHLEAAVAYKGLGNAEKARSEAEKSLFYSPEWEPAKDFLASL